MAQSSNKQLHSLDLELTAQQKAEIQKFWHEHGSLGSVEIKVSVVNDKISPASIQVGTAK